MPTTEEQRLPELLTAGLVADRLYRLKFSYIAGLTPRTRTSKPLPVKRIDDFVRAITHYPWFAMESQEWNTPHLVTEIIKSGVIVMPLEILGDGAMP